MKLQLPLVPHRIFGSRICVRPIPFIAVTICFILTFMFVVQIPGISCAQIGFEPAATIDLDSGIEDNSMSFLKFSPDSKVLAVGDGKGNLYTIDVETKSKLSVWSTGSDDYVDVTAMAFTRRGVHVGWSNCGIASFKFDGKTLKPQGQIQAARPVSGAFVAFSDDGSKVATSTPTDDNLIEIIDVLKKTKLASFTVAGNSGPVAFRPDGSQLAYRLSGSKIGFIDLKNPKPGKMIEASEFDNLAFAPDGNSFYTIYDLGSEYRLVDIEKQTMRNVKLLEEPLDPLAIAFSPNGKELALVGRARDSQIRICDVATGDVKLKRTSLLGDKLLAAAFSPDGKWLAVSAAVNDKVELWAMDETAIGTESETAQQKLEGFKLKLPGDVSQLLFSADGNTLYSSITSFDEGTEPLGVLMWNLATKKTNISFGAGPIVSMAMASKDRDRLIIGFNELTLWDISGKAPHELVVVPTENGIVTLNVSPDGKHLLTSELDKGIVFRNPDDLKPSNQATVELEARIDKIAISRDNRFLATISVDDKATLFDATSAKELKAFQNKFGCDCVAISPTENVMLFIEDSESDLKQIAIVDIGSTEIADRLTVPESFAIDVVSMQFSPDGKLLAAGDSGGGCVLWDFKAKKILSIVRNHQKGSYDQNRVEALAFSADSKQLATGGSDKTVFVYSLIALIQAGKKDETELAEADKGTEKVSDKDDSDAGHSEKADPKYEERTWKSANGSFSVQATLVEFDDESVQLQREDGTIVKVAIDKLSTTDRRYILKMKKQAEK